MLFEEYRSGSVAFRQSIQDVMMVYVDLRLRMLMDMFCPSVGPQPRNNIHNLLRKIQTIQWQQMYVRFRTQVFVFVHL